MVKYPNIDYYTCCGTSEKKTKFLSDCSTAHYPAVCISAKSGSVIVTYSGDTTALKEKVYKNTVPAIGDYDTSYAEEYGGTFKCFVEVV